MAGVEKEDKKKDKKKRDGEKEDTLAIRVVSGSSFEADFLTSSLRQLGD
jgi:hypothetical protein